MMARIKEGTRFVVVCHEHRLHTRSDVVSHLLGLSITAVALNVVCLPAVVLGLHGKNRGFYMSSRMFREHAFPHVVGTLVGSNTVLVDTGSGVLLRVGPLEATVVVAIDGVAKEATFDWEAEQQNYIEREMEEKIHSFVSMHVPESGVHLTVGSW